VEKGYAYVPIEKLVSVFVNQVKHSNFPFFELFLTPFLSISFFFHLQFRSYLSKSLTDAFLMFDMVTADTRIGPLLKNMSKQFIGNDFASQKGAGAIDKLTPEKIDAAAEMDMPLCMKVSLKSILFWLFYFNFLIVSLFSLQTLESSH
jgi:hypothetical protein